MIYESFIEVFSLHLEIQAPPGKFTRKSISKIPGMENAAKLD